MEKKWYAVYTKPRAEKKVFEELIIKEIEVYLPLQKKLKQWSDRRKWVEQPLINSYIFVKITLLEYQKVLQTNGVVRYICFSGKAVPIPDYQIENLKMALQNTSEIEVISERLQFGSKIKVSSGPLKGLTGELVEFRGKSKIAIHIDSIGYTVVINNPISSADFEIVR